MSNSSSSGTGPLLFSTPHQPESPPRGLTGVARMSDFFDAMPAEQPGGFHEEDGDQDHEGDAVLVLRAVGDVADHEDFGEPEDDAADDRARDVPDAAEHRGDERLHARQQAHERLD